MTSDLHTLTGAYALDALDDDERAQFEQHLISCEACQQEVAEFQATAATLASAQAVTPPPDLKAAVLAEVGRTRQERPVTAGPGTSLPATPQRSARGPLERFMLPAAAVLAVIATGLALVVASQGRRIADLDSQIAALESAAAETSDLLTAADLQTWSGPADAAPVRAIFSPGRGEGLFLAAGLEPAPAGHIYELWLVGAGSPVPAGTFDAAPDGLAVQALAGSLTDVSALAVTVEPAGGSPAPTTDPILVLPLAT